MATLTSLFCSLLLFATLLLVSPTTCRAQLPENHVAFFIFGDSLFDAGNNNYLNVSSKTNFWPYGETFFHYPTGRVCDGRIVPDFIAEYANLPLIKPYLEPGFDNYTDGVNFASAGAGVLAETSPSLLYLKLQISYFELVAKKLRVQLGDAEAKNLLSKAVYLLSMGGNDYMTLFSSHGQSTALTAEYERKYIGMVLGNYTSAIKTIYDQGGRKFAFQNVGPLGCMPATKSMALMSSNSTSENTTDGCVEGLQSLAKLHNVALSKVLKKLATQLPGFKYSLFDYYTSLGERTLSCSNYGFKIGTSACCGTGQYNGNFGSCGGRNGTMSYDLCSNPGEYVWFDAGHPTESTNKQLADLLWSGHPNVTAPHTLKMFFETS